MQNDRPRLESKLGKEQCAFAATEIVIDSDDDARGSPLRAGHVEASPYCDVSAVVHPSINVDAVDAVASKAKSHTCIGESQCHIRSQTRKTFALDR